MLYITLWSSWTVSYTHLDVYKRQVMDIKFFLFDVCNFNLISSLIHKIVIVVL